LETEKTWAVPGEDFPTKVREWCGIFGEHLNSLKDWCFWRTVRGEAVTLGLEPLILAIENRAVSLGGLQDVFDRAYYQWWCDSMTGLEPALRTFIRSDFEDRIRQFRAMDDRYTSLTRLEIQARAAAMIPAGQGQSPNSEMGILKHQLQKQRGHLPVRSLLQKIPNLLPRLKPCLLMSPISVAQYLDPAHPPFDLVVFDEASQIPVWDAVGAIARGSEVIVVGDPRQLPPTNFFMRTETAEEIDPDDGVLEDLESILDDCIAGQLPQRYLNWHYRSRHESLIAFSNHHYYENRLLTFPSPHRDMGVAFRKVAGAYDKGGSRTNRAEAEAVVAEVLNRLTGTFAASSSIGIVTFSQAQQLLIDDLLEETRRANPAIEPYFSDSAAEPLFVKNLENVQGDERDVILFSVCYGPDSNNRVSLNFGPLNRNGGERRLNVAITRARREVIVFSTLTADQIDLTKTRSKGVEDLKHFLDYAERGVIAVRERSEKTGMDECESSFEREIVKTLRDKGYTVEPQIGQSGCRIDLAVADPDSPDRYILGIECDGRNYTQAKTARDREKLRESVLTGLGWTLHRVWCQDFLDKRDQEIKRIEAALDAARKGKSVEPEPEPERFAAAPAVEKQLNGPESACIVTPSVKQDEPGLPVYEPYQVDGPVYPNDLFFDSKSAKTLCGLLERIVAKEGPISLDLASRRAAEQFGITRLTTKVTGRIEGLLDRTDIRAIRETDRVFLWKSGDDPDAYTTFRVPGNDENSKRNAEDLPPQEAANAVLFVLRQHVSLPVSDLIRETARLFGYQRTGPVVDTMMRMGITRLLELGAVREENGMIVLSREFDKP
jgi:very-short-patch-repair endonuclease